MNLSGPLRLLLSLGLLRELLVGVILPSLDHILHSGERDSELLGHHRERVEGLRRIHIVKEPLDDEILLQVAQWAQWQFHTQSGVESVRLSILRHKLKKVG